MICVVKALSKKKIEGRYIEHVVRILRHVVDTEYDGNQTRAAKGLGMSQPHLSNLLSGTSDRGPGLQTLIVLRHKTNQSIDALLGLPPVADIEIGERLQMSLATEIGRIKRDVRQQVAVQVAAALKEKATSDVPLLPPAPKKAVTK